MNMIGLLERLTYLGVTLTLTFILSGPVVSAQTFISGSTGADGALDFAGVASGTTILFDPDAFNPPLDQDNDNIYHFTTITIPAGVTVRLSADVLGVSPVVWLASGAVEIAGVLDLSGQHGHGNSGPAIPAVPGAGGYWGGAGRRSNSDPQPGNGPGGGLVNFGGAGGGAGHATVGGGAGGASYGNDFLMPLLGGSGGAGGARENYSCGGGAGGGALLIASSVSITVNGFINAGGGSSGGGCGFYGGVTGGGGSGGALRLMAPIISGGGGIFAGGGSSYYSGSPGRIRLEAFQHSFTGSSPAPHFVTPGLVFPPVSGPSVRVVRVGGVAVPMRPTGSFVPPDVSLDSATAVTVEIEARNIPLGTVVQLTIDPETGPSQTVNSTPIVGTVELSTATAVVTLPHGFSRFFVQANWTP